jgi:hypothetical protein
MSTDLAAEERAEAHRFLASIGLYLRWNHIFRMVGGSDPLTRSETIAVQALWDAEWERLKPFAEARIAAEKKANMLAEIAAKRDREYKDHVRYYKHIQPPALEAAEGESDLTDADRSRVKRVRREMLRLRLSGRSRLSDRQCLEFEGVIHRLGALSGDKLLVFKCGLDDWKSHLPIWQALQGRPTPKQMQESIRKLRKALDAIVEFQRSADRADVAVRNALDCEPALPPPETPPPPEPIEGREYWERDAKKNGGWLTYAEKTNERAERLEQRLHAEKPKREGPVPVGPQNRLIGIDLPNLYTKVFSGKYVPTRAPEIEFVRTCLALMGEGPTKANYIQECFKRAGKRRRERLSGAI